MTISSISPVTLSLIEPGDSFSFVIDDTYTSLVIQAVQSGGTEQVYSSATGVAAGYEVTIVDNGATKTFTVARSSGWNIDPTVIYVTEDESGASTQTSFSYDLVLSTIYPEGQQPYNSTSDSTFRVKESATLVRGDVSEIIFDEDDFNVASSGNGSVTITSAAAEGVSDHGALDGLADDDHSQYARTDGTRAQDAVRLTERSSAVNASTSGKAEIYLNNSSSPSVPYFKDELGNDYPIRIGSARYRKLSTNYSPVLYYDFDGDMLNQGSYGSAGDLSQVTGTTRYFQSLCGEGQLGLQQYATHKTRSAIIATPQTGLSMAGNLTAQVQMWISGSQMRDSGTSQSNLFELSSSTGTNPWWKVGFDGINNAPCAVWDTGPSDAALVPSSPIVVVQGGTTIQLIAVRMKDAGGGNMDVSVWLNGQKIAETLGVAVPAATAGDKYIQFGEVLSASLADSVPWCWEALKLTTALTDEQIVAEWDYVNGA
jgi:hypothetical protein